MNIPEAYEDPRFDPSVSKCFVLSLNGFGMKYTYEIKDRSSVTLLILFHFLNFFLTTSYNHINTLNCLIVIFRLMKGQILKQKLFYACQLKIAKEILLVIIIIIDFIISFSYNG